MKFYLSILILLVTISNLNAQTGSAEISSGGFSFIPAFTSKEPNLIGVVESISYDINEHFQIKGFVNYTFSDKSFISTIGVKYKI